MPTGCDSPSSRSQLRKHIRAGAARNEGTTSRRHEGHRTAFPKPCVAGSIPAGGTESVAGSVSRASEALGLLLRRICKRVVVALLIQVRLQFLLGAEEPPASGTAHIGCGVILAGIAEHTSSSRRASKSPRSFAHKRSGARVALRRHGPGCAAPGNRSREIASVYPLGQRDDDSLG